MVNEIQIWFLDVFVRARAHNANACIACPSVHACHHAQVHSNKSRHETEPVAKHALAIVYTVKVLDGNRNILTLCANLS